LRSSANRSSPSFIKPSSADLARGLAAELARHRNPKRAATEKAYLKSDLEFLGVDLPTQRALVRKVKRRFPDLDRSALLRVVGQLWRTPTFETRLTAVLLLEAFEAVLLPPDMLLLERLIRESRTWALVDELAIAITGPLVERHPSLTRGLDRWSRHPDFWLRRSSMLALLGPLRRGEGDFRRFAGYADRMLEEPQFFIRKAIGWVLRETSKRRPNLVYRWIRPRAGRASGVTLREAVKYLSAWQREGVLRAARSGPRASAASGRAPR
jgi:3-methyladenine DNA glycosylase AlkD